MKLTELNKIVFDLVADYGSYEKWRLCSPEEIYNMNKQIYEYIYNNLYKKGIIDIVPEYKVSWDKTAGIKISLEDLDLNYNKFRETISLL